jgi:spore germination protein Q
VNNNQGSSQPQYVNPYQVYPYYYPQTRQQPADQTASNQGMLPMQQSFIENILRLNRGKEATVYMTFEGNNNQTFKGIIEAAGRDHIILSDSATGMRYLLLMVYLNYITFDEEINYSYPLDQSGMLANYPPR